jgi:ABC-type glycerol-3-phosphate transport system substrate-binding protein
MEGEWGVIGFRSGRARRDSGADAGGWTRRRFVGVAAAAAATLGAGVQLLPQGAEAAAPASQHGQIHLLVSVAYQGGEQFPGTMQKIVDEYIAQNWTAKHPGVSVTTMAGTGCNGPCLGGAAVIAASVAGSPPDVITGCCSTLYEYQNANIMRPLNAFIQQDNIDLSVFSPGHLAALTTPQGILALPEYDGPQVVAVNEGLLDDLGLAYPSPDWTYLDAEKLWRSIAGERNGKWVSGIHYTRFSALPYPWMAAAWGGAIGSSDGTKCLLDSPEVIAAANWFVPLHTAKVIYGGNTSFHGNTTAMKTQAGWDIQGDLLGWQGMKWRYYPTPSYPAGNSTFINNDFYAINSYSKNPEELVWSIFKFLVLDTGFQELQWKTTFITPNRIDLWDSWLQVIYQVAPNLRDKNLHYMADAVRYGHSHYFFRYDDPAAENIESQWWSQILSGRVTPEDGLKQAAQQINALESAAAVSWGKAAAVAASAKTEIAAAEAGHLHAFTPPSRFGVGLPATSAAALVSVKAGQYTLLGDGADVWGGADNCVFAAAPETAESATYVARVTSLANVNCPHLSQWAKVGLMARGDLSNNAPYVAVMVTGENGIQLQYRPTAAINTVGVGGSGPGQTNLTLPNTKKLPNYLKQPVWLKLTRQIDVWTAYTSLDGKKWTAVGTPVTVNMAGSWVGLFATSHNDSGGFAPGQKIKASFDSLSGFQPNQFVQIGQP